MELSVVIPALNEAGNIGRLVRETYEKVPADCLAEVIVIDDASNDGTQSEIKDLIEVGEHPTLRATSGTTCEMVRVQLC